MRKDIFLIVVMGLIIFGKEAVADDVTGCPLGLNKGEFWPKMTINYSQATRAYWNENPEESPEMVSLPDGWHAKVFKSSLRVGYGITDNVDIGVLVPYIDKDVKKEVWKWNKKEKKWIKKPKEVKESGLADPWFAAKYKFRFGQKKGSIQSYAVGLGIKPSMTSDELISKGIGNGAMAIRGVFLMHEPLPPFDLCGDIWYQYNGKAKSFQVETPEGKVDWPKSDWDLGDKIGYRMILEYELGYKGKLAVVFGPMGWIKFKDKDKDGETVKDSDRYEHSLMVKLVYLPEEKERFDDIAKELAAHHRKIFLGFKIPVSVKNDFSPSFMPILGWMWTF
ncbi:MAG: transporter [bacterium]